MSKSQRRCEIERLPRQATTQGSEMIQNKRVKLETEYATAIDMNNRRIITRSMQRLQQSTSTDIVSIEKTRSRTEVTEDHRHMNTNNIIGVKGPLNQNDSNEHIVIRPCDPFCAPFPHKFRCRFKDTCSECFQLSLQCIHRTEPRLTVLLAGHNPSTHVWKHGYSYGNPTNRMWKLLTGNLGVNGFDGILPKDTPIEHQNSLPSEYGVGLAAIALIPGNDASELPKSVMRKWIPHFYGRLISHRDRVQEAEGEDSTYQGPAIVAFTGKRQFYMLYECFNRPPPNNIPYGPLPHSVPLPPNWPFRRDECQVWVLTSSSGRAALTDTERLMPYVKLAVEYKNLHGRG